MFKVLGKCCRNTQVFAQIILKYWITLRHTITGKIQDLEITILFWLMRFSSFLNFLIYTRECLAVTSYKDWFCPQCFFRQRDLSEGSIYLLEETCLKRMIMFPI